MGELSAWHWAVVVLVAVFLFGSQRLPDLARGIGRSARILKAELGGGSTPRPETDEPRSGDGALHERHPSGDRREAGLIAGVGQRVEHRDLDVGPVRDRVVHEVRADEAGTAGDEHTHVHNSKNV